MSPAGPWEHSCGSEGKYTVQHLDFFGGIYCFLLNGRGIARVPVDELFEILKGYPIDDGKVTGGRSAFLGTAREKVAVALEVSARMTAKIFRLVGQ